MSNLHRTASMLSLLALLAGCQAGVTESPPIAANCPAPVQGSRYSMCGRLSTNGDAISSGTLVIGNANSGTASSPSNSSAYQLLGGTFHASR